MSDEAEAAGPAVIQSLIWPEAGVCTERDLYVRLDGPAGLDTGPGRAPSVVFSEGGKVGFDTWFNFFSLGKWRQHCGLDHLALRLSGEGRVAVSVMLALEDRSWERVENRVVELGETPVIELGHLGAEVSGGAGVFLELTALGAGRIEAADWLTRDAPRREPDLMISVTTFKREAAVARTAARFADHMENSALQVRIRMLVVDNGQSAEIAPSPHVTVIPNENLGGAGGFSRGLIAARETGATHCLFMDDDASTHMQSLDRTWIFLAHALDPATAVAGAMINATHRWSIWENGARFRFRCRPLHMGTDLRNPFEAMEMDFESTPRMPADFYGGWWYFAFPLEAVRHMPFPFFVRGDDVSFSLVHDFNTVTLNGVVSFQDSFTDKESPLTWYLDLRSHMAHHLSLPMLEAGRWGAWRIAAWFFLRNLPRMHYETLAAINLALEDVMEGPGFFDANADMAARRADLKAMTVEEAWAPADPWDLPPVRERPPSVLVRLAMKLCLNGHLVPFYSRLGKRITLEAVNRGHIGMVWGASEITCLSADRTKSYTVRHSKRRAWSEAMRFLRASRRFLKGYDGLRDQWREGYDRLTSEGYWRGKLGLEKAG